MSVAGPGVDSGYEDKWTQSGLESLFSVDTHEEAWEHQHTVGETLAEQVINKDTTEKMTTGDYMDVNTNSDDLKSESVGDSQELDVVKETLATHPVKEDINNTIKDDDSHDNIKDKYLELVAHNTRLVDVLRTTLELQAELFRRITRYLFP